MGFKFILFLCAIVVARISIVKAQANMSAFCQRFPTNSNCAQSSSSSSSSSVSSSSQVSTSSNGNSPVNPNSVGLPPPPAQGGSAQQGSSNGDPCSSWRSVYDKYCVSGNIPSQYQSSCAQYQQTCVSGGSGGPGPAMQGGGQGGVNPNSMGLPPPPSQGMGSGPQPNQPPPQAGGINPVWDGLTQKAQEDQAQQALINAQNGQANCGQYQQNYNIWCGGAQQVNPVYCNTLGRLCMQTSAAAASGQSTMGGPFAGNGGLPTGGAGSTRPLTVGSNLGVGPFFGLDKTTAVNPLTGFGQRQGVNIPLLGLGVQSSKGVDWGGLPGVAQLGAALEGRRRRRWAIPMGRDRFGNIIYWL